ncbi:DUF1697 domain-containing protein [Nocardia sp. NBC_00565]|uniref:DUF1697 domain-containing protein n=1 Tax=Nocardia sp. NBC_00565 TaxID=2975993 RepID=UPI002E811B9A|nr:DUF1697 domain-containing protein [Nocardia sp. NBC_00565]WUC00185.1 DUF1697 domain-containing protein [Nocardia sp. NBC_00565]
MNRYAALLRGIMPTNPNMKNDKLRAVFEGLGFEKVATLLSSGNVVFRCADTDVPELEARIQEALNRELGIPGGTIIRSYEELRALLDRDPFEGLAHQRGSYLTVTFFKDPEPQAEPPELVDELTRIIGYDKPSRAFLTVIDNSTPQTTNFMAWLDKTYGKDITTRTWLTIQKIVKKLEA